MPVLVERFLATPPGAVLVVEGVERAFLAGEVPGEEGPESVEETRPTPEAGGFFAAAADILACGQLAVCRCGAASAVGSSR